MACTIYTLTCIYIVGHPLKLIPAHVPVWSWEALDAWDVAHISDHAHCGQATCILALQLLINLLIFGGKMVSCQFTVQPNK